MTAISWFRLENQNGNVGSKPVLKGTASQLAEKRAWASEQAHCFHREMV
jgi:hypothetical protein